MFGAQSEFGPLKRVLLHRPGEEMALVSPANLGDLNFARPVDAALMAANVDAYASILRAEGVEVHFLAEVLAGDAAALAAIRQRPNLVFLRDTAFVFRKGAVLMRMSLSTRQEDPGIVGRALERLGIPLLGRIEAPGLIEGGGISFLDETTCTMGLCDRANESAVRQMADLILGDSVETLVVLPMPKGIVHTDGQFMMVDRDLALLYPAPFRLRKARVLGKGGTLREAWLEDLLQERGIQVAEVPEGWDLNVVGLRPRQAAGLEVAQAARKALESRGGRYFSFDGRELCAGMGGPHCATLPLRRTPC